MRATIIEPKLFPLAGLTISLLFWILDGYLDTFVFKNNFSFVDNIFTLNPNELWMRLSFVSIVILSSLYLKKLHKNNNTLQEQINLKNEILNEHTFLETIDPLTLLFNKRKFYELLEYEMDKDKRYKSGLSVIFCCIDNFKNIEDKYSHSVVDDFLRNIALQLVKILRTSDIVSHWNDDEFLILIPNKTADDTKIVAEKIRSSIENHKFSEIPKATSSLGISQYIENDNKVSIVERAKKALNMAKSKGGNSIERF